MKDTGRKIKRVTMPSYGPSGEQSIYFITPGKGPRDSLEWETINYGDHGDPENGRTNLTAGEHNR